MKILLTGCASGLASATLPQLFTNDDIGEIIGIDTAAQSLSHPKFQQLETDSFSSIDNSYLNGVDALIHMAFVVNNGQLGNQRFDREYIRKINVEGSKQIIGQAISQNVKTIIHLSSAVVYGHAAGENQFVDESCPLKKIPGFYYSEDMVDIELWLDEMEKQVTDIRFVKLRPHVILGQYTQSLVRSLLTQPFYFLFPDPQPLTQCVWEGDVANAIEKALFSHAKGAFNLSCNEVTSFRFIQQHIHKFALPMPYALIRKVHQLLWKSTGKYGDPAWMSMMQHSISLDNEKARRQLDWKPTLNLFDSLDATV